MEKLTFALAILFIIKLKFFRNKNIYESFLQLDKSLAPIFGQRMAIGPSERLFYKSQLYRNISHANIP